MRKPEKERQARRMSSASRTCQEGKREVKQANETERGEGKREGGRGERERHREGERETEAPWSFLPKSRVRALPQPWPNGKSWEQDRWAAETASFHSWCMAGSGQKSPLNWLHKGPPVKYKLCPSLLLLCPLARFGMGFLGKDQNSLCLLEGKSHGPGPAGPNVSERSEALWRPWVPSHM